MIEHQIRDGVCFWLIAACVALPPPSPAHAQGLDLNLVARMWHLSDVAYYATRASYGENFLSFLLADEGFTRVQPLPSGTRITSSLTLGEDSQGLVAERDENGAKGVYVAFHGTRFSSKDARRLGDILLDARAKAVRFQPTGGNASQKIFGYVHKGFDLAARGAWKEPRIGELADNWSGKHFYVSGHSLGGATAIVFAAQLINRGVPADQITLITFAAPSPAHPNPSAPGVTFKGGFQSSGLKLVNLVRRSDPIPYATTAVEYELLPGNREMPAAGPASAKTGQEAIEPLLRFASGVDAVWGSYWAQVVDRVFDLQELSLSHLPLAQQVIDVYAELKPYIFDQHVPESYEKSVQQMLLADPTCAGLARLVQPAEGSTLGTTNVRFEWTDNQKYVKLVVKDLSPSGLHRTIYGLPGMRSYTFSTLPPSPWGYEVTLETQLGGFWTPIKYTFRTPAETVPMLDSVSPPSATGPAPSLVFRGRNFTVRCWEG